MSSSALLTTRGHIDLLRVASAACRHGDGCGNDCCCCR
ncbi:putative leader peptide [Streptomyces sp. NPDC050315]